jgi:hypothetical protein
MSIDFSSGAAGGSETRPYKTKSPAELCSAGFQPAGLVKIYLMQQAVKQIL